MKLLHEVKTLKGHTIYDFGECVVNPYVNTDIKIITGYIVFEGECYFYYYFDPSSIVNCREESEYLHARLLEAGFERKQNGSSLYWS